MVALSTLAFGLSSVALTLAIPTSSENTLEKRGDFNFLFGPDHPLAIARRNETLARRSNTNYNQDYTTGGTVQFSPRTNGFSVNWNTQNDFVVGVGWNPGSTAAITYSGTFSVSSGLGSLGVYGWTTNPLIEYYVMETNVGISGLGTVRGSVNSDGGTYTIYTNTRVNQPSIQGTSTFTQFISVRNGARTSGTVTLQNHFQAWAGLGMQLGTMNFQVIAVESWSGSGSASQSVSNTGGGGTGTGTGTGGNPTTTPNNNNGGTCSALWGQCGGIGWTGPKCCLTGSCKSSNAYYSQCLN
ncbi:hypothetical protein TWF106_011223 [Orbilia oligospora]|uniref:Endo-1,4-beta-xylanase n=1 Tax=Orbilia oligospora TaxID=2813651 RepID=A0A6G1MHD2_ORBOL|nr:hypothetical protein TWF679_008630 [Orbilia oligospora]KAF3226811.1 hypothetical protein TWF106_011223 [Orbilia oligospora]KAF3229530.1 hypothetical protein TWF191_001252 [Orbilia oligospora]KAF3258324.1 hypothetical protein TWF192_000455 [Orbilia oligospora]